MRTRIPRRTVVSDAEHERLIELLVRARLVTSDDQTVELAHESLARAWPRLRTWLDDDVEGQRILRHLALSADAWDSMDRPDSELYRGVRLGQALDWERHATPDLTPAERQFLDTSAERERAEAATTEEQLRQQTRHNRRLRALLAGVAVLLVGALVAGLIAVRQADRADRRRWQPTPDGSVRKRCSSTTPTTRCCWPSRVCGSTIRPTRGPTCWLRCRPPLSSSGPFVLMSGR